MTDTNKKIPADVYAFMRELVQESLRDWFKKEKWVRISSSGNIAGPCGTSKNKKNPDRCLPKAKAQSLTKGQRAATAQKKKKAGSKGKQVVKNTKKATVKKEAMSHPVMVQQRIAHAKKAKEKERDKFAGSDPKAGSTIKGTGFDWKRVTKEDIRNLVVGLLQERQGNEVLMEKDDRCTRLAKQKYDTWPSAYASGAVVRCRRGEIWKDEK